MPVVLPAWLTTAADALRRLADRPWTLFFLLLALNAIARPCSSTAHDARLYSLQALNQAEYGAYGDDVFLRFGSQDQYSLFSRSVGPLVAAFGLRAAFFALYLAINTLFIFGLFRFVRALVDDALVSTLSLMYLVTASLAYGGGDIFTVHEQFFTPRTVASAFTLLALERLVRGRFVQALGLLVGASIIHPLMAFGGVMIWTGCAAWRWLPKWLAGLLLAVAIAIAMILVTNLGEASRFLGHMDSDWHELIRVAVGYNYPDTWPLKDWLNIAISLAAPLAACWVFFRGDTERRRFLIVITVAGAIGLATTVAASMLPYALLFQGQPYRVLWILKVVQVPLGFMLIGRAIQSTSVAVQAAAVGLVAFFCVAHYIPIELSIFAIVVPISILVSQMAGQSWWYGTARGCVLAAVGWMAYRWVFFANRQPLISEYFDLNEWVLFDLVSPIFLIACVVVAAYWWRSSSALGIVRFASVAIAMTIPFALFATEISPAFQRDHTRLGADMAFVRDFVDHDATDGRRPCVYCPFGRTDLVWIDVRATSYVSIIQTAGVMFNRQTALEIDRRCRVVAKFEMARQREEMLFPDEVKKKCMEALYKIDFDCPEPTRDDLVRLCNEPGVDFIVVPQEFPGLYLATNGRVFVYECYKVRTNSSFSVRAEVSPALPPTPRTER